MAAKTTKDRILDAAERLFATQGVSGTSLRNVIKEAGVNTAAVHYHFGSREGLVEAVLVRRAAPINNERLRLLGRLEARHPSGPLPLEEVVEAFVAPVLQAKLDASVDRDLFRQLMGRVLAEADARVPEMIHRVFGEVRARFGHAFVRALPGLSREDVRVKMHLMIGAMALGIAAKGAHVSPEEGPVDYADSGRLLSHLVEFIAGGMRGTATR